MSRTAISFVAVWVIVLAGRSADAARLLNATIELNGNVVLQTIYTDDGRASPQTVWRYFSQPPGGVETANIQADSDEPLRATLRGEVVLRILHVDRVIVEGRAEEVTLVRTAPTDDQWHLPKEEVERIGIANDIAPPPPLEALEPVFWPMVLAGCVLVAFLLTICRWWVLSLRRKQPATQ